MVLNGKNGGFFLNLDSGDSKPVTLDLGPDKEPEATPEVEPSPMSLTVPLAEGSSAPSAVVTAQPQVKPIPKVTNTSKNDSAPAEPDTAKPSLTTAEAIAAELAAAEEARPVVTLSTFAPDNLLPGNGLRQRKRRPGSNLKGFKEMAGDLFKS